MTSSNHQPQGYNSSSLQHPSHSSTGYSYQQEASSGPTYRNAIATNHAATNNEGYGDSSYGKQQYRTYLQGSAPERSAERATTSAQTSLKQSSYGQQDTTGAPHQNNHTASTFSPTSWASGTYETNVYGHSNNQVSDRSQNTSTTPSYPAQAPTSNELTRTGMMNTSQTTPGSYNSQSFRPTHSAVPTATEQIYHTSYQQPAQAIQHQFLQRYSSPTHAVQAQNQQKTQHGGHTRQSVVSSKHLSSPHVTANQQQLNTRQNSASAEPQQMTINPSQIYDARAEQQRKAQIEADRRRKREEEAAMRTAEEDRKAEENRKLEEARIEEQNRKDREAAAVLERQRADQAAADQLRTEQEAAAKKAEKAAATRKLKAEQRKKANEEQRQSQTAASALQQMASGNGETDSRSGASMQAESTSEEAQMRAMFARMREFNAKNPNMLAKLWEEERQFANSQSPQPDPVPVPTPDQRQTPIAAEQHQQRQAPAPELGVTYSTPTLPPPLRPFQSPTPSMPAKSSNSKQAAKSRPQVHAPLWPKQKRPAISEVAVKWLMSLSENAGKVFHSTDILKILDGNPSYAQLCAGLQSLGAQFDQSLLARVILRGIPDLLPPKTSGADPARRPSNQPTSQSNVSTVAYDTPDFSLANATSTLHMSAPSDVSNHHNSASNAQINPASSQVHSPISGQPPAGPQAPVEPQSKPAPPSPVRPPANKQEAARKRRITDLVDLTAGDSDDEGPPTKMVMLQSGPGPLPSFLPPPMHGGPVVTNYAMRPPDQAQMFMGRGMLVPSHQHVAAPRPVVKPPPLKMPRPLSGMQGPTPEQLQQERIKGRILIEPIVRDRVARKSRYDSRTIARDVLLATGRHPDMRPLNQHLVVMSKLLSDHGAQQDTDGTRGLRGDLATIRWDIIDPEPPTSVDVTPKPATAVKDHVDAEGEVTNLQSPVMPAAANFHNSAAQPQAAVTGTGAGDRHKAKRGRPRKAVAERLPTSAGPPASSSTEARQPPALLTTELGNNTTHSASPSAMSANGGAVGYTAFRKYDENGNVIKTKGRPKGWKKALHGRQAQRLQPSTSGPPSGSKKTKPSTMKPLTEAQPQVYKCDWEGCPSELHNLETLKKHVVKLHDEENDAGEYVCRWRDCSIAALLPDFQSWTEHIYEAHMNPVAWKQGDGPKGGVSDYDPADAELYLSDAHGRSVTPIIDPDTSTPPKQLHDDAAALKGLIDHRRIVGPSFEKGGCTLANEKRRRGFLDDEDFEYHYEEDEDGF